MSRLFSIDIDSIKDLNIEQLSDKKILQLHRSVINRASKSAKAELSKLIRDKLNVKKKIVDREIFVTINNESLRLYLLSERPLRLYHFIGTRQNNKGVSVKIFKSGPRNILRHAFMQPMKKKSGEPSGFQYVAWRATPPYRVPVNTLPKNYKKYFSVGAGQRHARPTLELSGPRVADIADNPNIINATINKFDSVYFPEMDRRIQLEIDKI